MEEHYRILIENGSKRLEIESHDKTWVEKQKGELIKSLRIFEGDGGAVSARIPKDKPSAITSTERTPLPKMSINEFYKKYCAGLKSNTDKAVYFIYYLSWVEQKKNVSTNDVRDLFITVGIPRANDLNYADILARAKKRALLNYIGNYWSLTITGEDFVVNKIQGQASE